MTKTMVIQHFNLRLTYIFQQEIWMRSKQTPSTSSHSVFGLILVVGMNAMKEKLIKRS